VKARIAQGSRARLFSEKGRLFQNHAHTATTFQFDPMALTVIKAYRFNLLERVERPRQPDRGILTAREQHKREGIASLDPC
jgi:hypothetical protein